MRIRLFVTDATDLITIINERGVFDPNLRLMDIVNDWVNVVLRETNIVSVHQNHRSMNERDLLDILHTEDIAEFEDTLIHTINSKALDVIGCRTTHHEIIDNQLEFYTFGG